MVFSNYRRLSFKVHQYIISSCKICENTFISALKRVLTYMRLCANFLMSRAIKVRTGRQRTLAQGRRRLKSAEWVVRNRKNEVARGFLFQCAYKWKISIFTAHIEAVPNDKYIRYLKPYVVKRNIYQSAHSLIQQSANFKAGWLFG